MALSEKGYPDIPIWKITAAKCRHLLPERLSLTKPTVACNQNRARKTCDHPLEIKQGNGQSGFGRTESSVTVNGRKQIKYQFPVDTIW
jgi:hypothetical protein